MLQKLSVLAMFGVCSFEDIRDKQIPVWQLACFIIEGILWWILWWKQPLPEFLSGILPGAAVLLMAAATHGSIGEGDGILLMAAGIFLGASCTVRLFMYAVFFSSGCAVFLFTIKKKSRDYEMPFVPFLLISFVGELLFKM